MVKILIQISIVTMMLDVGLQLTTGQVKQSLARWKALAVGTFENVVIVPIIALLLLGFTAEPLGISAAVIAALALTGVAPGAPIDPKMVQVAKGDIAYASLLMLTCQLVSIISAPLLAQAILPETSKDVSVAGAILTLIGVLLVPLAVGMFIRAKFPKPTEFLAKVAQAATSIIFLVVFVIMLATQIEIFTSIEPVEYLFMIVVTAIYAVVALPMPGLTTGERVALTITSGGRNFALAMVLAAKGFGGEKALGTILVLAAMSTSTGFLLSWLWGRRQTGLTGTSA